VTAEESVLPLPVMFEQPPVIPRSPNQRMPPSVSVKLSVKSACSCAVEQPVTAGIPFPKGMLADATCLRLVDPEGHEVLLQALHLNRWSDGSVKWLLLDSLLPSVPDGCTDYKLTPGSCGTNSNIPEMLSVVEHSASIVVSTGTATFHLSRTRLGLDRVLVGTGELLEPESSGILLTDQEGRQGRPQAERVNVEACGPVRATVKYEGMFTGRVHCRFTVRYCFFRMSNLVRVRLTLHNPNRARHSGGLWDLGDAGSMFFRDLSLRIRLKCAGRHRVAWTAEPQQAGESAEEGPLEIFQASSGGDNWQSKNHVNRTGQVPCPFRGYRVRSPGKEVFGLRANPVISVRTSAGTVAVAIPEFWQQFPKALDARGRDLWVRLFPEQWGDLFELQGGEQKTHTAWLHFGRSDAPDTPPLEWVHRPALVHASPEWYAGSGAVPHLVPASNEPWTRLERYLDCAVVGKNSFFSKREIIDEYGWRNFGETYADHEGAFYSGPAPVISHYNNQYDVVYGTLLQYLRTGARQWHDLFEPLARHVMDIDIYHTSRDRPAYNGGLFWPTDHYKDAATCTHRTYSTANYPSGNRSGYGGGPSNEHNYTTGLLHYYFLTGDPQARDAVIGLSDWVIGMDDADESSLGLIDDGPTGMATSTRENSYHGPGRGSGNSVNALLDGWLLAGEKRYLEKAEELIRRSIHPNDNIAARNLLDVENRWSYTMFLSVLARYLDLKIETGDLDFMYGYARAGLLAYACWMLENEEPYFDNPERLEFPTETWAAQEFRKSTVFRLAAVHADEPLRKQLLARGTQLAERAWTDLLRFESRHATRAVAVVLTEGVRDCYFRQQTAPVDAPSPEIRDFGTPGHFIPQKARVQARLKTLPGFLKALARLARPRSWRALARRVFIQHRNQAGALRLGSRY
jgi:hypothetical protein